MNGERRGYAIENAVFQWEEGERRLRDAPELERADLLRAVDAVIEELRRRLGSSFTTAELADLYAENPDWASDIAQREAAGTDSPWVVDAAFSRYVREAADYAGGQPIDRPGR
jgi:hypothetical protein